MGGFQVDAQKSDLATSFFVMLMSLMCSYWNPSSAWHLKMKCVQSAAFCRESSLRRVPGWAYCQANSSPDLEAAACRQSQSLNRNLMQHAPQNVTEPIATVGGIEATRTKATRAEPAKHLRTRRPEIKIAKAAGFEAAALAEAVSIEPQVTLGNSVLQRGDMAQSESLVYCLLLGLVQVSCIGWIC